MTLNVKIKKERIIGIFLVLIPFVASYFFIIPYYNYFTTTGDVVHVNQLGIKGNVYFAFVRSGYTKNLYEKYSTMLLYRSNIEFQPVDQSEVDEQIDELNYEAELRNDTIQSAVQVASMRSPEPQSISTASKMNEIISKSEKYYGDSFGLMVAIGLTEELEHEDFSKNNRFKIAGTGTMRPDRKVGPVGGIRYKVISAEKKGMQYFFVPNSEMKSFETGLSNKEEAYDIIKEKNMKIKIIPIDSLDEAVTFLRSLP